MAFFDTDFETLISQLLPVGLRKSRMIAWLKSCLSPVVTLHNQFKANRNRNLYYISHGSQVTHMEAVLNDIFDPGARQIVIVDGPYKDPLFLYHDAEAKEIWTGLVSEAGSSSFSVPQVLYSDAETTLLGNGFIIQVPVTLPFDVVRMRAIINQYRIAGQNIYEIETV